MTNRKGEIAIMKRLISALLAGCMLMLTAVPVFADDTVAEAEVTASAETEAVVPAEDGKTADTDETAETGYYKKVINFDNMVDFVRLYEVDPSITENYIYSKEYAYIKSMTSGRLTRLKDHTTGKGQSLLVFDDWDNTKGKYNGGAVKFFNLIKESPLTKDDIGKTYRISFYAWSDYETTFTMGLTALADIKGVHTADKGNRYSANFYDAGALKQNWQMPQHKVPAKKWTLFEYVFTFDETMCDPVNQIGMLMIALNPGEKDRGTMIFIDDMVIADANAPIENQLSVVDNQYDTDSDYEKYEGENVHTKKLFTRLKLLKNFFGVYSPAKTITRDEFAGYIAEIIGMSNVSYEGEPPFEDCKSASHAAEIRALKDLKIMNGDETGRFRPGDNITYAEAVAVLIKLMGYGTIANTRGGYPAGYIGQAKMIGLTDEIADADTEAPVTHEVFLKLLTGLSKTNIMTQTLYGDAVTYNEATNYTVLSEYHNVYYYNGVVKANSLTSLDSANSLGDGSIRIEDTVFDEGTSELGELLGYKVNFWCYKNKNTDIPEIIYGYKADNNKVLSISAEHSAGKSGNSFVYYNDDFSDRRVVTLKGSEKYIVNGLYSVPSDAVFNIDSGSITFVDNNNDGLNDVIFVDKIDYYVVSNYDAQNKVIYDKYDKAPLSINSANVKYRIINTYGEAIDPLKLTEWSVLSVREGKNTSGAKVDIIVSGYTSLAKIDSKKTNANGNVVYKIGDVTLNTTRQYNDYVKRGLISDMPIGEFVTIYQNENGEVVAWKYYSEKAGKIGYVITSDASSKGLNDEVRVKMVTVDNQIEVFSVADKVKVNGTVKKVSSDAAYIAGCLAPEAPVYYELNDENKIRTIKTVQSIPVENNSDGELIQTLDAECYYVPGGPYLHETSGKYGNAYTLTNKVSVFKSPVSAILIGDENFYAGSLGSGVLNGAANSALVTAKGYTFGTKANLLDVLVIKSDMASFYPPEECGDVVITSLAETLGKDGNKIYECTGYMRLLGEIPFYIEDLRTTKLQELSVGDIVQADVANTKPESPLQLTDYFENMIWNVDYIPETERVIEYRPIYSLGGSYKGLLMYPYNIEDGYLFLNLFSTPATPVNNIALKLEDPTVYVVDTRNNTVTEGNISDLTLYKNNQNVNDTTPVFVRILNGTLDKLVIYRR